MTKQPITDVIYRLSADIAMESFTDGALLLRLTDRHLLELNHSAQRILELTDGQRSVRQVASALAQDFQIPEEIALQDVILLCEEFVSRGIIDTD